MQLRINLLLWLLLLITVPASLHCKKGYSVSSREMQQGDSKIVKISASPKGIGVPHIYFRNQLDGWIWYNNEIWRTLDGGANWSESQLEKIEGDINSLEILDISKLWMLAGDSLNVSSDGGKLWRNHGKLSLGYPKGILLKAIPVSTTGTGWLIGSKYVSISKEKALESPHIYVSKELNSIEHGVIYKTEDDGNTWKEQLISPEVGRLEKAYFLTPSHGVAVGQSGIYYIRGNDAKWEESIVKIECLDAKMAATITNRQYEWYPADIYLFDSNEGWLTYNDGRLLKTNDGGKSWCDQPYKMPSTQQNEIPAFLRKIRFVDAKNGYALRSDGLLLKTRDNGHAWSSDKLFPRFDDIHLLDDKTLYGISEQGVYKILF